MLAINFRAFLIILLTMIRPHVFHDHHLQVSLAACNISLLHPRAFADLLNLVEVGKMELVVGRQNWLAQQKHKRAQS